jgi:hypothetical protein
VSIRVAARFLGLVLAALALSQRPAPAGPFKAGNLVVLQVGDGSATPPNSAAAVFLKEFTTAPGSAAVQTLALPTVNDGGNFQFTLPGFSPTEGALTLSANGQFLTLAGYAAPVGTANVAGVAGIDRVVARVDQFGNINTSTRITDGYLQGPIRSAVTDDGTRFWTGGAGAAGGPTAATGGTRFVALGASTSTQVSDVTITNVVGIHNGQLYTTSNAVSFRGVSAVGSGLPTTDGHPTTLLPGFPGPGTPSPYSFVFANDTTLYVADDRAPNSGGGIQKWVFSGGTWSLAYRLFEHPALNAGYFGLTGASDGTNFVLYAVAADTSRRLVTVTDLVAGSAFTTLQELAPGSNMLFRGVAFAPVPEPGALLLAGAAAGGFLAVRLRRRRQAR